MYIHTQEEIHIIIEQIELWSKVNGLSLTKDMQKLINNVHKDEMSRIQVPDCKG